MFTMLLLVLVVVLISAVLWKHKALQKSVKDDVALIHYLASKDYARLNCYITDAEVRLRACIAKVEKAAVSGVQFAAGVRAIPSTTASAPPLAAEAFTAVADATGAVAEVKAPTEGAL